jgi:4-carboxymuconolactone decarboxylase
MAAQAEERYARGQRKLQDVDGNASARVLEALGEVCPDLGRLLIEFPLEVVYGRPGLDLRSREIATVAALVALGAIPQLKVHLRAALNVGVTRAELLEVIIQMAIYAGFPAALNAAFAAQEVFAERTAAD